MKHAQAIKRIERYLKGTKDKGLFITPNGDLNTASTIDAATATAMTALGKRISFFQGVVVGAYTSTWLFSTLLGIGLLVKGGGSISSFLLGGRKK